MDNEHAMVARAAPGVDVTMQQWNAIRAQAETLLKSNFLPNSITKPEQAIAIIQTGRELGVPPMYALRNIVVINGRPTLGAGLMLALIYRDHGGDAVHVLETSATACTLEYKRRDRTTYEKLTFTIEEARRAGLADKENWKKYPAAMLRARAISAVAGLAFPDSLAGMYTPEEMTPDAQVDPNTGEFVEGAYTVMPEEPAESGITEEQKIQIRVLLGNLKLNAPQRAAWFVEHKYPPLGELTEAQADDVFRQLGAEFEAANALTPERVAEVPAA